MNAGSAIKVALFDVIAGVAGLFMIIGSFGSWYAVDLGDFAGVFTGNVDVSVSGWEKFSYFGWLIFFVGLGVLALAALDALVKIVNLKLPFKLPTSLIFMGAGAVCALIVVVRMFAQPGDNKYIALGWGIWVSLVGCAGILAGGFLKLSEGPAPTLGAAGAVPQYGQPYAPQYGVQQYAQPQAPAQPAPPQAPAQYAAPQAPPQYAAPQAPVAPSAPAAPATAVAPEAQPAADFGFCTSCGAAYPAADAQFCTSCGAERGQ